MRRRNGRIPPSVCLFIAEPRSTDETTEGPAPAAYDIDAVATLRQPPDVDEETRLADSSEWRIFSLVARPPSRGSR